MESFLVIALCCAAGVAAILAGLWKLLDMWNERLGGAEDWIQDGFGITGRSGRGAWPSAVTRRSGSATN